MTAQQIIKMYRLAKRTAKYYVENFNETINGATPADWLDVLNEYIEMQVWSDKIRFLTWWFADFPRPELFEKVA